MIAKSRTASAYSLSCATTHDHNSSNELTAQTRVAIREQWRSHENISSNNESVQKRTLPTKQLLSVKEGLRTNPRDFGLLISSRQQLRTEGYTGHVKFWVEHSIGGLLPFQHQCPRFPPQHLMGRRDVGERLNTLEALCAHHKTCAEEERRPCSRVFPQEIRLE